MDTVGSCTGLGAVLDWDWQREQETDPCPAILRELPKKAGPPAVAVVAWGITAGSFLLQAVRSSSAIKTGFY